MTSMATVNLHRTKISTQHVKVYEPRLCARRHCYAETGKGAYPKTVAAKLEAQNRLELAWAIPVLGGLIGVVLFPHP
jgi:hypothetical protein